jgi:hypothetical protein
LVALIIIIVVFAAILLLPVGVDGRYDDGVLWLSAKAGPAKIRLLPKKEKPAKPKRKKRRDKAAERKPSKKAKKMLDKDTLLGLVRLGLRALGRFRRKLSVDSLTIHWTAAAKDPFSAAMQYGYLSAAMGALWPLIDGALKIRMCDIHTDVSFETDAPVIFVQFTATLQIWEILYIALAFGAEYLAMKRKLRRQRAAEERKNEYGKDTDRRPDGSDHVQAERDG